MTTPPKPLEGDKTYVAPNEPEDTPYRLTFGQPPQPVMHVTDANGDHYCQVHTDRASELRCIRCGRYLCVQTCIRRTPVGYRCRECVRDLENNFFNASVVDYAKLFAIVAVLSGVGAFFARFFFLFLAFFVAIAATGVISEVAMRVVKGLRGRYSGMVAAAAVVFGSLVVALAAYISILPPPEVAEQLARQGVRFPSFFEYLISDFGLLLYMIITAVGISGRFSFGRKNR